MRGERQLLIGEASAFRAARAADPLLEDHRGLGQRGGAGAGIGPETELAVGTGVGVGGGSVEVGVA